MSSYNKVILAGNVGADAELKHSASGQAICDLRLATNRSYTDSQGERHDETQWHRIVAFGRVAEQCGEFVKKGRQILVEGRLNTRSYEDKDGIKRYVTEVVANQVTFLGPNREKNGAQPPLPAVDEEPVRGAELNF